MNNGQLDRPAHVLRGGSAPCVTRRSRPTRNRRAPCHVWGRRRRRRPWGAAKPPPPPPASRQYSSALAGWQCGHGKGSPQAGRSNGALVGHPSPWMSSVSRAPRRVLDEVVQPPPSCRPTVPAPTSTAQSERRGTTLQRPKAPPPPSCATGSPPTRYTPNHPPPIQTEEAAGSVASTVGQSRSERAAWVPPPPAAASTHCVASQAHRLEQTADNPRPPAPRGRSTEHPRRSTTRLFRQRWAPCDPHPARPPSHGCCRSLSSGLTPLAKRSERAHTHTRPQHVCGVVGCWCTGGCRRQRNF